MKKIIYTGAVVLATLSFVACESSDRTGDTDSDQRVVETDSVATEFEVTETVVEYDTTTRTKSVDVDRDRDKKRNN